MYYYKHVQEQDSLNYLPYMIDTGDTGAQQLINKVPPSDFNYKVIDGKDKDTGSSVTYVIFDVRNYQKNDISVTIADGDILRVSSMRNFVDISSVLKHISKDAELHMIPRDSCHKLVHISDVCVRRNYMFAPSILDYFFYNDSYLVVKIGYKEMDISNIESVDINML